MRALVVGFFCLLAVWCAPHEAQAQAIVLPCVPSGTSCIPVSAANPLPTTGGAASSIISGATRVTGCTNEVLTADGTSHLACLAGSNQFVYLNGSGLPSVGSAIPFQITTTLGQATTSPITGDIVTAGGIGVGGALNVGGNINTGGCTATNGIPYNSATGLQCDTGYTYNSSAGVVAVTPSTVSSSPSTGALVVSGGLGVGGTLNVGGGSNISSPSVSTFSSTSTSATQNIFNVLNGTATASGSAGSGPYMLLGVANSSRNAGAIQFTYTSSGSTSNYMSLGLNGFSGVLNLFSSLVALPSISSDATHTDASICEDTTTHALYSGSGTLGICLGTSGRQFKTDLIPMEAGLMEINALKLWNYHYLPGWGDGGTRMQFGPTAQDVETVPGLAMLVGRNEFGETINYDIGAMIPISLHAIQELDAKKANMKDVEDLRSKIDILSRGR